MGSKRLREITYLVAFEFEGGHVHREGGILEPVLVLEVGEDVSDAEVGAAIREAATPILMAAIRDTVQSAFACGGPAAERKPGEEPAMRDASMDRTTADLDPQEWERVKALARRHEQENDDGA